MHLKCPFTSGRKEKSPVMLIRKLGGWQPPISYLNQKYKRMQLISRTGTWGRTTRTRWSESDIPTDSQHKRRLIFINTTFLCQSMIYKKRYVAELNNNQNKLLLLLRCFFFNPNILPIYSYTIQYTV